MRTGSDPLFLSHHLYLPRPPIRQALFPGWRWRRDQRRLVMPSQSYQQDRTGAPIPTAARAPSRSRLRKVCAAYAELLPHYPVAVSSAHGLAAQTYAVWGRGRGIDDKLTSSMSFCLRSDYLSISLSLSPLSFFRCKRLH